MIVIRGAGPVGMALALALRRQGQHCLLVDPRPLALCLNDPRALALSRGSLFLLQQLGVHPQPATPIRDVHVSQQGGLGRTVIKASDYGFDALGCIVRYGHLCRALADALDRLDINRNAQAPAAPATLTAHCEGASDEKAWLIDYQQQAIVATLTPREPHNGRAWERFTADGPLALLPLGNDYALVWTRPVEAVAATLSLDDADFAAEVEQRFANRLAFSAIQDRAAFPLKLRLRRSLTAEREVWLGNAAQTLHPVSGQGFNLGLRDAWELAETIGPLGDPGDPALLRAFSRRRQVDRLGAAGFTDTLIRIFTNDRPPLHHARGAGLLALDLLPSLRAFFSRRLMFGIRG